MTLRHAASGWAAPAVPSPGHRRKFMPYAIKASDLADFQCQLIGTWENCDELVFQDGDKTLPLSYNVMPLPQKPAPTGRTMPSGSIYGGFILKNFSFNETIRFNGSNQKDSEPPRHYDPEALAIAASAPNRGGTYTQSSHVVFYDQQVRFAEGPDAGKVVHVENGAWLHLGSVRQLDGPYALGSQEIADGRVLPQPAFLTIAKQISVPHGNSVLALGKVDLFGSGSSCFIDNDPPSIIPGRPIIPDADLPFPAPADIVTAPCFNPFSAPLGAQTDFENPNIGYTKNPNRPLQQALDIIKPTHHYHWRVTTDPIFAGTDDPLFGGRGIVTNIPFEKRKSEVIGYTADYWLMSNDGGCNFDYLAYNQLIFLQLEIFVPDDCSPCGGKFEKRIFPHVTANTVKRVSGTPDEARHTVPGKAHKAMRAPAEEAPRDEGDANQSAGS
ncbi:hypothetical protein [Jiella sp. M17.18]|uniref:hypothetical protein n=1 Tax=Jiella sp. M17.18 TaxID=3234247 RepID=UPI0034DE12B9